MAQTRLQQAEHILISLKTHLESKQAEANALLIENKYTQAIEVLEQTIKDSQNGIWNAEDKLKIKTEAQYDNFLKDLAVQLDAVDALARAIKMQLQSIKISNDNIAAETTAVPSATPIPVTALDTNENPVLASESNDFDTALNNLRELTRQPHTEVNNMIIDLIMRVSELKYKNESIAMLTKAMNDTYRALTEPAFRDEFRTIAKDMEGKSSTIMKVIGGIMLSLSIAIVALGIVFAPVLAGLIPLAYLTANTVGITTAFTGGAFAVGGLTLFAKSGETGLAKEMRKINTEVIEESVTYDSIA
jgi:tetratricopeptide (TPR) repeat protein